MVGRRRLGRRFGWLWASYAVSAYGTGLGFGALPLIAVLVLHAGPGEVAALSAVGPAVGALIAVPLVAAVNAVVLHLADRSDPEEIALTDAEEDLMEPDEPQDRTDSTTTPETDEEAR